MITGCTVCHKLDFVVYLQDSVTGELIQTSQVEFFCGGNQQPAVRKEAGIYAFLNMGAGEADMTVRADGYWEQRFQVVPETYSKREGAQAVPILWISMVPGVSCPQKRQLHIVSGKLVGIDSICGFPCSGWQMRIRGFEKKTAVVKLFNPHGRYLYPVDYGIMDQEKKTFEQITVREQIAAEEIRILSPYPSKFTVNSPVDRIVKGVVEQRAYYLPLRPDVDSYLIRWTVRDRTYYRELNMRGDAWKSLDGKGGIPWDK